MPARFDYASLAALPARTPALADYTPRERALISSLRTPRQVQRYLRTMDYNWEATLRTFRGVVATKRAQCLEAVFFAAAVLEQHGHPPLVLDIESVDGLDHVLLLFQHRGKWGTVARSRDYGLHGRAPVYASLRALVQSYMDPYIDGSGRIIAYGVAHLDALSRADWRRSNRSVWQVERAMINDLPHVPLLTGERRYRRALRRYEPFKASGGTQTRAAMRKLYGEQIRHWW